MKNITLSAEEELIHQARLLARQRRTSFNQLFRDWLRDLTRQSGGGGESYDQLMQRLGEKKSGGHFTRDEMNER